MDFGQFYNKYFQRVHAYACYRCSGPQEADELTSLIFEKLFKKYSSFNPEKANIEVWLFSIAKNVVIDYYRWHKIRSFFSITEYEEILSAPDDTALSAQKREEQKLLFNALAKLPQREREILGLKYSQGFNNKEIAAVTGLTESNTGVIIMRAVKKLRNILEGEI